MFKCKVPIEKRKCQTPELSCIFTSRHKHIVFIERCDCTNTYNEIIGKKVKARRKKAK